MVEIILLRNMAVWLSPIKLINANRRGMCPQNVR